MYKYYTSLDAASLDNITKLCESIKLKVPNILNIPLGHNGQSKLSIYRKSDWLDWTSKQRLVFRSAFPRDAQLKLTHSWLLEIPPGKGFLDTMDKWVNHPSPSTVIMTALKTQSILLNGKSLKVLAGEQIGFKLSTVHEIKPTYEGQLWLCALYLGCPFQLKP